MKQIATCFIKLLLSLFLACFMGVEAGLAQENMLKPTTIQQINELIKKSANNSMQLEATPEVVAEINRIRSHYNTQQTVKISLQRMKEFKPMIQQQLQELGLPNELLIVPILESRYEVHTFKNNTRAPAGLWQMLPGTARKLGLTVNAAQDDRRNPELATKAALHYFIQLHEQFPNWQLTILAYKLGGDNTQTLIQRLGSQEPWVIARSSSSLKTYLAQFNAIAIIMDHPELLND